MGTDIDFVNLRLQDLAIQLSVISMAQSDFDAAKDMYDFHRDQHSLEGYSIRLEKLNAAKAAYQSTYDALQAEIDKSYPGKVEALYQVFFSGAISHDEVLQSIQQAVENPPSDEPLELPTSGL